MRCLTKAVFLRDSESLRCPGLLRRVADLDLAGLVILSYTSFDTKSCENLQSLPFEHFLLL